MTTLTIYRDSDSDSDLIYRYGETASGGCEDSGQVGDVADLAYMADQLAVGDLVKVERGLDLTHEVEMLAASEMTRRDLRVGSALVDAALSASGYDPSDVWTATYEWLENLAGERNETAG